jgi:hypothetical protein
MAAKPDDVVEERRAIRQLLESKPTPPPPPPPRGFVNEFRECLSKYWARTAQSTLVSTMTSRRKSKRGIL